MPTNILSPVGPAPIEITQGDVLAFQTTAVPGVGGAGTNVYTLQWRMKLLSGVIQTFTQSFTIPLNGVGTTSVAPLQSGWLLSVVISASQGSGQRGQVTTQVFLGKPVQNSVNLECILIQESISGFYSATWPAQVKQPVDGSGMLASVAVGAPAAGANFSSTSTSGVRFKLVNIRFRLVTSAAVANRQVGIKFTDPAANIFASRFVQGTQAASLTIDYNFAVNGNNDLLTSAALIAIPGPNDIQTGVPPLFYNDATVIASVVRNLDVADQLSLIVFRYEALNEID